MSELPLNYYLTKLKDSFNVGRFHNKNNDKYDALVKFSIS